MKCCEYCTSWLAWLEGFIRNKLIHYIFGLSRVISKETRCKNNDTTFSITTFMLMKLSIAFWTTLRWLSQLSLLCWGLLFWVHTGVWLYVKCRYAEFCMLNVVVHLWKHCAFSVLSICFTKENKKKYCKPNKKMADSIWNAVPLIESTLITELWKMYYWKDWEWEPLRQGKRERGERKWIKECIERHPKRTLRQDQIIKKILKK